MTTETLTYEDCLDHSPAPYENECSGAVEYRMAMSPTGVSFVRCDGHFEARWETQQRISRDYGVPLTYDQPSGWADEWEDY